MSQMPAPIQQSPGVDYPSILRMPMFSHGKDQRNSVIIEEDYQQSSAMAASQMMTSMERMRRSKAHEIRIKKSLEMTGSNQGRGS